MITVFFTGDQMLVLSALLKGETQSGLFSGRNTPITFKAKKAESPKECSPRFRDPHEQYAMTLGKLRKDLDATRFNEPRTRPIHQI
jgi:hypothetical protein